jgi:serine/threonine protein kinase
MLSRLNHPAIVAATDAGAQQGTHYLVMELVEGLDLSRFARLVGELPIADACELGSV